MATDTLGEVERLYANEHTRKLSGLYGVLNPNTSIYPYRLCRQTKIQVGQTRNLYEYWCDVIEDYFNQYPMEREEIYINLASNEYSRVIQYLSKKKSLSPVLLKYKGVTLLRLSQQLQKKQGG